MDRDDDTVKYQLLLGFIVSAFLIALTPQPAAASGLKIAPLEYRSTLTDGETKRGFVDISNPAAEAISVRVTVQAFRQIDDDGGLQFYDDTQLNVGIIPELTTLELGSREAIRLFFTINGKSLPAGDVYAALFFTTEPKQAQNGVGQSVRVGTLLSLVNGSPSERNAEITALSLPIIQFDNQVKGSYRVKNTGPKDSGFYPTVTVSSWPVGRAKQTESSLVFGGRERSNDFTYGSGYGIHRIDVGYGGSKKSQWVLTIAPWMVVAALLVILIVSVELLLLKKRRSKPSVN